MEIIIGKIIGAIMISGAMAIFGSAVDALNGGERGPCVAIGVTISIDGGGSRPALPTVCREDRSVETFINNIVVTPDRRQVVVYRRSGDVVRPQTELGAALLTFYAHISEGSFDDEWGPSGVSYEWLETVTRWSAAPGELPFIGFAVALKTYDLDQHRRTMEEVSSSFINRWRFGHQSYWVPTGREMAASKQWPLTRLSPCLWVNTRGVELRDGSSINFTVDGHRYVVEEECPGDARDRVTDDLNIIVSLRAVERDLRWDEMEDAWRRHRGSWLAWLGDLEREELLVIAADQQ